MATQGHRPPSPRASPSNWYQSVTSCTDSSMTQFQGGQCTGLIISAVDLFFWPNQLLKSGVSLKTLNHYDTRNTRHRQTISTQTHLRESFSSFCPPAYRLGGHLENTIRSTIFSTFDWDNIITINWTNIDNSFDWTNNSLLRICVSYPLLQKKRAVVFSSFHIGKM